MAKAAVKVYPNSPLQETVFEIRFPGEPAIECHRDEIYDRVRDILPKVFVPSVVPAQAPALQHYQFKSDDEFKSLLVSLNSLAYSTKKYPGFPEFKKQALSVLLPLGKRFRLNTLNRVGLRYINLIPFTRRDGAILLDQFLNLRLVLSDRGTSPITQIQIVVSSPCEKGSMTLRIESVTSPDQAREALLLDFDYSRPLPLKFSEIESYLEEGHTLTKKLFESLITDEYRKVMETELVV
jgi:uncharacterized protein (TIGR04255 family)